MYIPLFNTRTFIKILSKLKNKKNKIIIYYDDECGFCSKISGIFKIFNLKRNIKIIGLSKNKEIDKNVATIPIKINEYRCNNLITPIIKSSLEDYSKLLYLIYLFCSTNR